jgi:thioredoxin-like negative regulator of GroEL
MPPHLIHVDNEASLSKYNQMIKKRPTMVLFYMPGCGHCEMLKPEWNAFETEASPKDTLIAKVHSDYVRQVDGDSDVIGFPTIFHLMDGKKQREYSGARNKDGLKQFLREIESQKGGKRRRKNKTKTKRKTKSKRKSVQKRTHKRKRNKRKSKNKSNKHMRKYGSRKYRK